ncbi:hypothetical protein A0H81_02892 [Grifola frondosa]|uniref:Uncharacterized protein n=1 Tax=Grifola frondosa TaxID=5627 RepID=A0A1C7ML98_GRIFR|nr:hypothetical protein A0H81_02892 [Grifola frondosa]
MPKDSLVLHQPNTVRVQSPPARSTSRGCGINRQRSASPQWPNHPANWGRSSTRTSSPAPNRERESSWHSDEHSQSPSDQEDDIIDEPILDHRNPAYTDVYCAIMMDLHHAKMCGWGYNYSGTPVASIKAHTCFWCRQFRFMSVFDAIKFGVAFWGDEDAIEISEDMKSFRDVPREKRELYLRMFTSLLEAVPCLEGCADNFRKSTNGIDYHARSMHGDDIGFIKFDSMQYIEEFCTKEGLLICYSTGNSKTLRGFKDTATARMLCPMSSLAVFDEDPEYFKHKVHEGSHRFTHKICLFRHLFMGRHNARIDMANEGQGGRKPIAEINKMNRVMPENIAYVCVLVHFILNDQREWHLDDGDFKGQDFYDLIVNSFKDDEDWGGKTLKWWNFQIFGIIDDEENSDEVEEDNEWAQMVAQCAARRAQALAAILTSPTCSPSPVDNTAGNHSESNGEGPGERFQSRRRQDEADDDEDEDQCRERIHSLGTQDSDLV